MISIVLSAVCVVLLVVCILECRDKKAGKEGE